MIQISSIDSHHPALNALSVLVVDDALETQISVRSWLEALGHSVVSVCCGDEAVRLIKQQSFDLVITEVIMPNGDGLEVILQLKRWQPAAKSIAISAGGKYLRTADCLRVAKGLGATEVLPKPLTRDSILGALRHLQDTSERSSTTEAAAQSLAP